MIGVTFLPQFQSLSAAIICLSLILLQGCKHDNYEARICDHYTHFMDDVSDPLLIPSDPQTVRRNPSFNPMNYDEFSFVENRPGFSSTICIYNLRTKEKRVIFTGSIFSRPCWGSSNKIIFSRPDYNIWSINPDGTELIMLTNEGCHYETCWSPSGNRFRTGSELCQDGFGSKTYSLTGELISQSKFGMGELPDMNSDSIICASHPMGLVVLPADIDTFIRLNHHRVNGACWLDDRNIIWSSDKGIHMTDYISRQSLLVKSSCAAMRYLNPDYNPISNKVIWRKVVSDASTGKMKVTNSLVMMYPDGSMEEEIFIP
jgi:hypothetical protein